MSHTCRDEEGNIGCISCYAAGEDQGTLTVSDVLSQHQVQGFIIGKGFLCSCSPYETVDYSSHINELLGLVNKPETFELDNTPLEDLAVSGHEPTGESVAGFLGRCSCGAATDDFREHLREVRCHCYSCSKLVGPVWWMVTCPSCGSKRCQHAENHKYECRGDENPNE